MGFVELVVQFPDPIECVYRLLRFRGWGRQSAHQMVVGGHKVDQFGLRDLNDPVSPFNLLALMPFLQYFKKLRVDELVRKWGSDTRLVVGDLIVYFSMELLFG